MGRLILSLDSQILAEYNMGKERYTIGRLPDNDVRIDNAAVSGHHALLINILNDSFLEDLNSTNGTYVNGKLIKKHALQHGDIITTGHHQLRFEDAEAVENSADKFEKTMVITSTPTLNKAWQATRPIADVAKPSIDATRPAFNPRGAAGSLPQGKLQVLSGGLTGREMALTKTLTTLGRPGVQVAAITRRADGFYLVHVEGGPTNRYPSINDVTIGARAQRLHDNDVLCIADVKMSFFVGE